MNYFYSNSLLLENGFALTEVDKMIPWEKKVYIEILIQKLKEKMESSNNIGNRNEG